MPAKVLFPSHHGLTGQEILQSFNSDLEKGLTAEEVARRYERYGWNELQFKPGKPAWLRFLLQFNQPLLYILLLAGGVKAFLGSWVNAAVIWGVTLINAVIGYVQDAKAEGAIASLAKAVTTEATVLRDGQILRIPSPDLVPGDLVLLVSGDKVPADIRLLSVRNLQVDESALTGESVPVHKSTQPLPTDTPLAERNNMAYAGSFATFGQGKGIVVATANATEVGQISQSMERHVSLSTPLTRKFAKFSQTLLYGILTLASLTFAIGLGQGESWVYMFEAAIALAVSAIPEGLPAVVTITLAIGVNRMATRHAIIRKLPAVETLGSATVICSDKTGTLTENQMTVQRIYAGEQVYEVSGSGYSPKGEIVPIARSVTESIFEDGLNPTVEECLRAGLLCNDSRLDQTEHDWSVVGDPTEGALITAAKKAGLSQSGLVGLMPRLDAIPFESQYQYMATLQDASPRLIYVKGSVEAVLGRCSQMLDGRGQRTALERQPIEQAVETMAAQGLRVLVFAKKEAAPHQHSIDHDDLETGLVFLGLQGMIDPPRPEAIAAIRACHSAGIQVKMITGDHISTARAIAQRMGIQKSSPVKAFEGWQLAQMDDSQLAQAVEDGDVFARVAPAQKLQLVEALQSKGEVVAMTGDGVNDAPALKQADIGMIFGIFEWAKSTTGDVSVARTMAIQALVAARIVYLLSISQLGMSLIAKFRRQPIAMTNAPAIIIGIVSAVVLQILFSQLSVMNALFATAPLNLNQWLICLIPALPMIPTAIFANSIDSIQSNKIFSRN